MNKPLRLCHALAIIALCLAIPPSSAFACTPPPGGLPTFTVADRVNAAAIVVEGVVTATTGQYYPETATLQVIQYIKGSGTPTLVVDGYGPEGICLASVYVGDHAIFYIDTDQVGYYHALYLSQFDAAAPADSQTIVEAIAASGQQPVVIASVEPVLTQVAATQLAAITATPTPSPYPQPYMYPSDAAPILTEAYATSFAAATAYPNDPAGQSAFMTQAYATVEALRVTATPTPSFACASSPYSIADHTKAANVVLEGVVSGGSNNAVIVQVVQYLKLEANGFAPTAQINFAPSGACPFAPPIGSHYIFFAIGEPTLVMYALDAGEYAPLASPDPATIAEITAASGQSPIAVQDVAGIEARLAATASATSPAAQTSIAATQSMALTMAASPYIPTPPPYPFYPTPYYTPTPPPTSGEIIGLLGIGGVVGLIVGVLIGIVIGLFIGRWRE